MAIGNGSDQLDRLLGGSIAAFDISDELYAQAVARYEDAAEWLSDYWSEGAGEIYPQGSIRLGTMVAPINPEDDYDIDLVCRRDLGKESTSQAALKSDVGAGLDEYVTRGSDGAPTLTEGKRCWTLDYRRQPFHMDVLPALPDSEHGANAILLTDTSYRLWLASNPIDFASWFLARMDPEYVELRESVRAKMGVEDPPPSTTKTTLQRSVQALKRHRDIYFRARADDKPASVIITTLAARAYRGGGPLHEVLVDVAERMPLLVENRDGRYRVENPVAPEENFADRWREHPERAELFFRWIERAHLDFARLAAEPGVDQVMTKLRESFGLASVSAAGRRFGQELAEGREASALGMAASGLLGPAAGRAIPRHTFHGEAPSRRP